MNVKVRHLGGKRFEMTTRCHVVLSDQPFDNDGADSAMTPPELFLSSLGACAGHYAAEYLLARDLDTSALEIRVSAEKGDKPARIISVAIEVEAPGLSERHREGILRSVNRCLLEKTLEIPPKIDVKFVSPAEAPEETLAPALG